MPPFVRRLASNPATDDELAGHGLTVGDAVSVLYGNPKIFPNRGHRTRQRQGRPSRWMMIGKGRTGMLLTIIIEGPNSAGEAHIVTGWPASRRERAIYDQPGGRRNRP